MAEGHSIVRWARALAPMVGDRILSVDLPKRWEERKNLVLGHHAIVIDTRGKHLLLHLSSGYVIHTHAMMYGSWQFGLPGMALSKPERNIRLRLTTDKLEAVFYNGPVVEVLSSEELASHPKLLALGPDVLSSSFDREEAWRRIRSRGDREIADLLLDQTIISGVGNIFKSESLFLAALHPRRRISQMQREEVERLWEKLIPIMKEAAATSGPITTLPPALLSGRERNWVYARSSRPCFLCAAKIRMIRQGDLERVTYFCPTCQSEQGPTQSTPAT